MKITAYVIGVIFLISSITCILYMIKSIKDIHKFPYNDYDDETSF